MPTPKLPIWRTLGQALRAPFSLDTASWKALSRPVLAVIVLSFLPVVVNYLQWNVMVVWLVLLPIWAALAWFAVEFQCHLLLGAAGCRTNPRPWRRYGLYFLAVVVAGVFLALFVGLALQLVLPAVVFFSMALNSPDPWLASGTVVLPTLVVVAAVYPLMRFSLVLPALSVSHDIGPKRVWRITRGNGLRLLSLLVLIPGLVSGIFAMGLPIESAGPWVMSLLGIVDAYLSLVFLSILALAYRALSDQPLPAPDGKSAGYGHVIYTRLLRPVGLMVLVGIGAAAVWDSFYRVEPGENIVVSRMGNPKRVESDPGIQVKIPFVEDAEPIPEDLNYVTVGEGVFLTMGKTTLPLEFQLQWHVVDGDIFARTTAGQTRHAERWIETIANEMLRDEVSKMSKDDVSFLRDAGKVKYFVEKGPHDEIVLNAVLPKINSKIAELGIEISEWQVEAVDSTN